MIVWTMYRDITGKERRGQQEGFKEGDNELDHVEQKEPTLQGRGEAPRQRAQSDKCVQCVSCKVNSYYRKTVPWSSALGNTRLNRFLHSRTSQVFNMLLWVMNLQGVSPQHAVLLKLI